VVAAPVIVDRLHLRQGIGRAILVNSGNANACTGAKGLAAAKKPQRCSLDTLASPHTMSSSDPPA